MSSKRFLVTQNLDDVNYAKDNGYEVFDFFKETKDTGNPKRKHRYYYYYEYTQELYFLFMKKNINCSYHNPGNLSIGQIADLMLDYPLARADAYKKNLEVDEIIEEEELDVVRVLEIRNPNNSVIEYLNQYTRSYDLYIYCKDMFSRVTQSFVYKINGQESSDLIQYLERYYKKSEKGKICLHQHISYHIRELTS